VGKLIKYKNGDLYNTLHKICYQLIVFYHFILVLDLAGMSSKSAQSFINKVRREGELHPAFS
jgi:thiosulfate reductase cytochrome b subunit